MLFVRPAHFLSDSMKVQRRQFERLDDDLPPVPNLPERGKPYRFEKGNKLAVGRSSRRRALDDALRACVSEDDLQRIARRLVADAARGSVRAAELLFDRVLGKPRLSDAPAGAVLALGAVDSLAGCRDAASAIVRAAAAGELDLDAARALASMVDASRAAIVATELEERIVALEREGTR